MGLFPKINVEQIKAEINGKFDQLLAKLDEILQAVKAQNKGES
jgi:hypothetical protein